MSDHLVLELLRAIRDASGELKTDMIEVKERLGSLEQQYSSISHKLDRVGRDVEVLKRRLNLGETTG